MSKLTPRAWRACLAGALVAALAACAPPEPTSPRPTAPAILDITPAPTQNIDATATAYAVRLVPTPTPAGLYVVQPNDTLSGLAEDFGTTVEELMAANNLTDPNAIQAGQTLIIPALITSTLDLGTATALPAGTAALTPTLATTAAPAKPTAAPASP
jgi:LysM repeat protein